jgi:hypothetical protein
MFPHGDKNFKSFIKQIKKGLHVKKPNSLSCWVKYFRGFVHSIVFFLILIFFGKCKKGIQNSLLWN